MAKLLLQIIRSLRCHVNTEFIINLENVHKTFLTVQDINTRSNMLCRLAPFLQTSNDICGSLYS